MKFRRTPFHFFLAMSALALLSAWSRFVNYFFFSVGLCKLIHKWKNRCLRYEDDALGFIKNIQPSVSLSCTFFRIAAAYGLFPALFLLLQLLSFHSSPRLRLSQTLMLLSLFCNYPHCFLWWCGRENPVGQGRRPPRIAQQRPSRFRNSRPPQGFLASLLGRIRSVFPVLLIFFFFILFSVHLIRSFLFFFEGLPTDGEAVESSTIRCGHSTGVWSPSISLLLLCFS